jgi:hypothetical protein
MTLGSYPEVSLVPTRDAHSEGRKLL